jgi:hypothetical protein
MPTLAEVCRRSAAVYRYRAFPDSIQTDESLSFNLISPVGDKTFCGSCREIPSYNRGISVLIVEHAVPEDRRLALKPELWRRAEELFHAALERPPEARRAFLDEACGKEDAELRRQVELLLSKDEHAGSLLEEPLLADGTGKTGAAGPLVGRQIGSYRILSSLGAGGIGKVYRAHDSKLSRDVAVKTLPPEFASDRERLARFRREAHTLASLNHPNIEAIYGLEESEEADYLILELVEGDSLHGPLPLATALDRACQVAEALQAAHEHGIIHRDLKPANVKVTPQGKVKILDFGLAKAIGGREGIPDLSHPGTATDSVSWHVVGTPGYMSPEQARGGEIDQRADIWAFGCLLFELLTGKRAFKGETVSDTIAAVLEHEPEWRALPAETPAKVRELLRQCLHKDANRRQKEHCGRSDDFGASKEGTESPEIHCCHPPARLYHPRDSDSPAACFLGCAPTSTQFPCPLGERASHSRNFPIDGFP